MTKHKNDKRGTPLERPYPVVNWRGGSLVDQIADLRFCHVLSELRLRWQQETGKSWQDFCREADILYSGFYNNEAGRVTTKGLWRISRVLSIRVVIENGELRLKQRDQRGRYAPVEPEATGKVPEEG